VVQACAAKIPRDTTMSRVRSTPDSQTSSSDVQLFFSQIDGLIYRFPITRRYILPYAKRVESKTGLKPETQCRIIVSCLTLYMALGIFARLFCNTVGFIFPAYKSCKVLEDNNTTRITKWLMYWVVYTVFLWVDYVADFVLHLIPFYNLIKVIVLVWAMNEQSNGATRIYGFFIKPYVQHLRKLEDRISDKVDDLRRDSDIEPFLEMHRNLMTPVRNLYNISEEPAEAPTASARNKTRDVSPVAQHYADVSMLTNHPDMSMGIIDVADLSESSCEEALPPSRIPTAQSN